MDYIGTSVDLMESMLYHPSEFYWAMVSIATGILNSEFVQYNQTYIITIFLVLLILFLWLILRIRRGLGQTSLVDMVLSGSVDSERNLHLRKFRRRDKMLFYGRKLVRTVKHEIEDPDHIRRNLSIQKERIKKLLLGTARGASKSHMTSLKDRRYSSVFYEEGFYRSPEYPSEVASLLRSTRLFGILDHSLIVEIIKKTETCSLHEGDFLFRPGDNDDSLYIIQSGRITVFTSEPETLVAFFGPGQNIHSRLSILDVMSSGPSKFKTLTCRADTNSVILKLPISAFLFYTTENNVEPLIRVMQVLMVRINRIIFYALHDIFDLGRELFINLGPRQVECAAMLKSIKAVANNTTGCTKVQLTDGLTHAQLMDTVAKDLASLLGIAESDWLRGRFTVHAVGPNTTVIHEEETTPIIMVLTGCLKACRLRPAAPVSIVSQLSSSGDEANEMDLFTVPAGRAVGMMSVLAGETSVFTLVSRQPTIYASITSQDIYWLIVNKQPSILTNLARLTNERMSGLARQIDFALEWTRVEAGLSLYKQDEASDSVYVVLSGRMRSVVQDAAGNKEMVGEFGRGELFGLLEMVTKKPRMSTMLAVRDTELVRLPAQLVDYVKLKHTQMVSRLIQLIGQRVLDVSTLRPVIPRPVHHGRAIHDLASTFNLNTVALVAQHDKVPLVNFCHELLMALNETCACLLLTSDVVRQKVGPTALDGVNEYLLTSWLGHQEEVNRIVLYQCDSTMTTWTQRCLKQADAVLVVALAGQMPTLSRLEVAVHDFAGRIQQELVLLYSDQPDAAERVEQTPRYTVNWLNAREWVVKHHHIRCAKRVFTKRTAAKARAFYTRLQTQKRPIGTDFARLARHLTGTSVGLVLGGGGARGSAHIGVIKALQERGIPIDVVAGVSIGSFMGALWAMEQNTTTFPQKARSWSASMTRIWPQLFDLTYPYTSLLTGSGFNKLLKDMFGKKMIEDLWIPYFTITTDVTESKMRVHDHGSVWHYVRGSMTLASFLPPLCDPQDGHYLLDGGYVNNLPADIMRTWGCKTIFAVDVGAVDDTNLTDYGESLSGWWVLWKRWNPFSSAVKIPSMSDIQSRLAYVACVQQLETVKHSKYCHYLRPPIDRYATLQFSKFDEIVDVGYQFAQKHFDEFCKSDAFAGMLVVPHSHQSHASLRAAPPCAQRRLADAALAGPSFTDLAQLVSGAADAVFDDDVSEEQDELDFSGNQSDTAMWTVGAPSTRRVAPMVSDSAQDHYYSD